MVWHILASQKFKSCWKKRKKPSTAKETSSKRKKIPQLSWFHSDDGCRPGMSMFLVWSLMKKMKEFSTQQKQHNRMLGEMSSTVMKMMEMLADKDRTNQYKFQGPISIENLQICGDGSNNMAINPQDMPGEIQRHFQLRPDALRYQSENGCKTSSVWVLPADSQITAKDCHTDTTSSSSCDADNGVSGYHSCPDTSNEMKQDHCNRNLQKVEAEDGLAVSAAADYMYNEDDQNAVIEDDVESENCQECQNGILGDDDGGGGGQVLSDSELDSVVDDNFDDDVDPGDWDGQGDYDDWESQAYLDSEDDDFVDDNFNDDVDPGDWDGQGDYDDWESQAYLDSEVDDFVDDNFDDDVDPNDWDGQDDYYDWESQAYPYSEDDDFVDDNFDDDVDPDDWDGQGDYYDDWESQAYLDSEVDEFVDDNFDDDVDPNDWDGQGDYYDDWESQAYLDSEVDEFVDDNFDDDVDPNDWDGQGDYYDDWESQAYLYSEVDDFVDDNFDDDVDPDDWDGQGDYYNDWESQAYLDGEVDDFVDDNFDDDVDPDDWDGQGDYDDDIEPDDQDGQDCWNHDFTDIDGIQNDQVCQHVFEAGEIFNIDDGGVISGLSEVPGCIMSEVFEKASRAIKNKQISVSSGHSLGQVTALKILQDVDVGSNGWRGVAVTETSEGLDVPDIEVNLGFVDGLDVPGRETNPRMPDGFKIDTGPEVGDSLEGGSDANSYTSTEVKTCSDQSTVVSKYIRSVALENPQPPEQWGTASDTDLKNTVSGQESQFSPGFRLPSAISESDGGRNQMGSKPTDDKAPSHSDSIFYLSIRRGKIVSEEEEDESKNKSTYCVPGKMEMAACGPERSLSANLPASVQAVNDISKSKVSLPASFPFSVQAGCNMLESEQSLSASFPGLRQVGDDVPKAERVLSDCVPGFVPSVTTMSKSKGSSESLPFPMQTSDEVQRSEGSLIAGLACFGNAVYDKVEPEGSSPGLSFPIQADGDKPESAESLSSAHAILSSGIQTDGGMSVSSGWMP